MNPFFRFVICFFTVEWIYIRIKKNFFAAKTKPVFFMAVPYTSALAQMSVLKKFELSYTLINSIEKRVFVNFHFFPLVKN